MNILLISSNICVDPYPVYPLGVSVVAGALAGAGHSVTQADILVHGMDGIRALLSSNRYGMIGIGIRNIDLVNSTVHNEEIIRTPMALLRLCREFSSAPVVFGGAGFSLLPDVLLDCSGADYGVAGEGEAAMIRLASGIASGNPPPEKLLRFRSEQQSPALYDPALLAFYTAKTHMIPMQTKRGCPCGCVYCTYPALEGCRIRERSTDEILSQIQFLRTRHPDSLLFFVDSIFNDPRKEYKKFLQKMKDTCGTVPFDCFITPWTLSQEDMVFLRECGMLLTDIGIDATTDATLRGMNKHFTFREAKDCVTFLRSLGVSAACSVMFGGPGETYDTIREGIANLHSMEPAVSEIFAGVRILPGTKLYEIAKRHGKIPKDWNGIDSLYYYEDGLDPEKVHSLLLDAFAGSPYCIYPPDRKNNVLRKIHKIGYLNYLKFTGKTF